MERLNQSKTSPVMARGEVESSNRTVTFDLDFAELKLGVEWIKIKILEKNKPSEGSCLIQRIDDVYSRFEVKIKDLAPMGSYDNENEEQARIRIEFEAVEKLLAKKGGSIAKTEEDGNCLFRGVAKQVLGDPEKHQEVRTGAVEQIIAKKSHFSPFETDIDERLSNLLMNRSWGGELEIVAISQFYNVGIIIWELSQSGELAKPSQLLIEIVIKFILCVTEVFIMIVLSSKPKTSLRTVQRSI